MGNNCDSVVVPPSLQRIWLLDTRPDINISLIYDCPNLVEYRNHQYDYGRWESLPDPSFSTSLVMQNIETFTWTITQGIADGSAFQNLFLPVLRKLHLISPEDADERPVIDFIHKHSTTLVHLELEQFIEWGDVDHFRLLFQQDMPNLHTLKVTEVSASAHNPCIQALTPTEEEFAEGLLPIPSLKYLCFEGDSDEGVDEPAVLILKMLRMRRAGEHFEFHVDVPDHEEFDDILWPEELRDDFREYAASHRVTVTQGQEVPCWLSTGSVI